MSHVKARLYLASGQVVDTLVDAEEFESADDVREHLANPPKPHWSVIGNVCTFTQAVEAIALDD